MKHPSAEPLRRLQRFRDFQERCAQVEYLRLESGRIESEHAVMRAKNNAQAVQSQRAGLLQAAELDLARVHECTLIESHAWQAVSRAEQARDDAQELAECARQQYMRKRQASQVVAQRADRQATQKALRCEKTDFDLMSDLVSARRTTR